MMPPYPIICLYASRVFLFFFNDTATTEIYTLSLHDALPISRRYPPVWPCWPQSRPPKDRRLLRRRCSAAQPGRRTSPTKDRKSTRLNSSHSQISYAVFCLKKKNNTNDLSHAEGFTLPRHTST